MKNEKKTHKKVKVTPGRILKNLYKLRNQQTKPDFRRAHGLFSLTEGERNWILINTFITENFPGEDERQIKANQDALRRVTPKQWGE